MTSSKGKKTDENSSVMDALICVFGIYSCYLSYGIVQEKIFKYREPETEARFSSTLFLLCLQCCANALMAFGATWIWPAKHASVPALPFSFTAATYLGAMLCSNEALKHVTYPTQALAKSCKMIPVMLMGVVLQKRRYSTLKYACVMCITCGIVVFQYGKQLNRKDSSPERENSFFGLSLLFLSLFLDGITGPKQEQLSIKYQPSVHQQMFWTNVWACGYTLMGCLVSGQGLEGLVFLMSNPILSQYVVVFAICSALGQNFIFRTIQCFSALACTTITTTRKFFTILISVLIFGHSLSWISWSGVVLVFLGLVGDLSLSKSSKSKSKDL